MKGMLRKRMAERRRMLDQRECDAAVRALFDSIAASQEQLPPEFEVAIFDNLEELYEK